MSKSNIDIYKSIRKKMPPPGGFMKSRKNEHDVDEAEQEIKEWKDWRGEPIEYFDEPDS